MIYALICFLLHNISVHFDNKVCYQIVARPMDMNCTVAE